LCFQCLSPGHWLFPRNQVAASVSEEPVFTIQTSLPSISATTTATPTRVRECFSNGSTVQCPESISTSTSPLTSETDVFCTPPTSLSSGLCISTILYTQSPTVSSAAKSTDKTSTSSKSADLSTSTSIRIYPCKERTTTYQSSTYAINCLDGDQNYVACPTNITIVPTSIATSSISTQTSKQEAASGMASLALDTCTSSNGSASDCPELHSSGDTSSLSSSLPLTRAIISQCFNQKGLPTICPTITCDTPFVTAPGPAIPTNSVTMEAKVQDTLDTTTATSERIFQSSPAPIITSIANAPAFLTSSRPS
jgi:hypothetical protein